MIHQMYLDRYTLGDLVLDLQFDGPDGSTAIIDTSPSAHPITVVGNAQIDTSLGVQALLLDGNGDYLIAPDSVDWFLSDGDWTIQMYARAVSLNPPAPLNFPAFLTQRSAVNDVGWLAFWHDTPNGLRFTYADTGGSGFATDTVFANFTPLLNVWYHYAWTRFGPTIRSYAGGSLIASYNAGTDIIRNSAASLYIGSSQLNLSESYWNGWFAKIQIIKGRALYTGSSYTPPSL